MKTFYPQCQFLNPDNRDRKGRFFCDRRNQYVQPAQKCFTAPGWKGGGFHSAWCAPDCLDRSGKTRVPTL